MPGSSLFRKSCAIQLSCASLEYHMNAVASWTGSTTTGAETNQLIALIVKYFKFFNIEYNVLDVHIPNLF
jgi:hypothetical protein